MQLEEHSIRSADGAYSRKVWLLPAGGEKPRRLGVFLDGEFYVHRMDTPATMLRLQEDGAIPPMVCAFISQVNGEARHEDLTCNPRYAAFVAEEVVPWLRERDPSLEPDGHLVAGPSLGGLAAAYLALTRGDLFSQCLSHSGSFWWNEEWLKKELEQMPAGRGRFWISVGDKENAAGVSHPPTGLRQDVTQIAACERFATALGQKGYLTYYEMYPGDHDFKPWADELPRAVSWLLG